MITKASEAALQAFAQLQETPRWRDVDTYFTTEIEAVTLRLIGARDTADVHELKGRLAVLRELRQVVLTARDTLKQLGRTVPLT